MIFIEGQPISHFPLWNWRHRFILDRMHQSSHHYRFLSESELAFETQFRKQIVHRARALYQSGVRFATFYHSKCNATYWKLTDNGGFDLKQGIKPSIAIQDIYENGTSYAFECATAMVIILLGAALDIAGAATFDQVYPKIRLWDWHYESNLPLIIQSIDGDALPGDVLYFKNPDVNPLTPQWQGENTIVMEDGTYYGHGIGIRTKEQVIKSLNKFRKAGADRSAYLLPRATRVDFKRLKRLLENQ